MNKKIRRRCKCGCGSITKLGRKYIFNHHLFGNANALGNKLSKETKKKMSLAKIGNTSAVGNSNWFGKKHTKESKLKMSLSSLQYHPNDEYCDIWRDGEYKEDLKKDYCENVNCKKNCKRLCNHHINLNKKDCRPANIMTLCNGCHSILHRKLEKKWHTQANPKDYIIINRPDHVSYIHKSTRTIIINLIRI